MRNLKNLLGTAAMAAVPSFYFGFQSSSLRCHIVGDGS
jgi:hypothetical protein